MTEQNRTNTPHTSKPLTTLKKQNLARNLCTRYAAGPSQVAVLVVLLSHCSKDGAMFPSQKTLAAECACSERTVRECLNHWKELGVLVWRQGGKKANGTTKSNRYYFDVQKAVELIGAAEMKFAASAAALNGANEPTTTEHPCGVPESVVVEPISAPEETPEQELKRLERAWRDETDKEKRAVNRKAYMEAREARAA